MTEAELTRNVLELARLLGWRTAHFRPAMNARGQWRTPVAGDGKGFPDLIMVHPSNGMTIYAIELKVGKNKPTPEQHQWLDALKDAGCHAAVWTDKDWLSGQVERELRLTDKAAA